MRRVTLRKMRVSICSYRRRKYIDFIYTREWRSVVRLLWNASIVADRMVASTAVSCFSYPVRFGLRCAIYVS